MVHLLSSTASRSLVKSSSRGPNVRIIQMMQQVQQVPVAANNRNNSTIAQQQTFGNDVSFTRSKNSNNHNDHASRNEQHRNFMTHNRVLFQNNERPKKMNVLNIQKRMLSSKADFYKTLGVKKGDDKGTIKKAYFKLAKQYHPDTNKVRRNHKKNTTLYS